jgi:hypothetical protein
MEYKLHSLTIFVDCLKSGQEPSIWSKREAQSKSLCKVGTKKKPRVKFKNASKCTKKSMNFKFSP